jgi:hypothetical protein
MFRRLLLAAIVSAAFVSSAAAVLPPAAANTSHKLIVAVKRNLAPAAEKKLTVLVLISRDGGAPAGALATPAKPLTVLQRGSGLYRVKAEINSSCKGSCSASYRISGSVDHRLEVVPSCRVEATGFVCSKVRIVKVY